MNSADVAVIIMGRWGVVVWGVRKMVVRRARRERERERVRWMVGEWGTVVG